jgi:hypothetical protein
MYTINGRPIPQDAPFIDANGTQYPANWIRLASDTEKAAIGIEWIADPEPYDDRYYWSAGNPKDLGQCKAMLVAQVKQTAASLLAPTDWKVIRFIESAAPIGIEVTDYRTSVRTASNDNETAINACTTVEELAALQLTWPENE